MSLMLKSAYLPYDTRDGKRYLVESLWPGDVETSALMPFDWLHELAPSYALTETALWKRWEPEKFREEYGKELQEPARRASFDRIAKEAREGAVTLLHRSRKDEPLNLQKDTSVYYLKELLDTELGKGGEYPRPRAIPSIAIEFSAGSGEDAEAWFNEGGR